MSCKDNLTIKMALLQDQQSNSEIGKCYLAHILVYDVTHKETDVLDTPIVGIPYFIMNTHRTPHFVLVKK